MSKDVKEKGFSRDMEQCKVKIKNLKQNIDRRKITTTKLEEGENI